MFVDESGTAEKVGMNQFNPQNIEFIFVLVSHEPIKPHISSFKSTKNDDAFNDEDLSAVTMPIRFV